MKKKKLKKMSRFKVKVRYTFNVEYDFEGPENKEEAIEWAEKHVAMTTSGLTTSLPEGQCDWTTKVHGEKTIVRVVKQD